MSAQFSVDPVEPWGAPRDEGLPGCAVAEGPIIVGVVGKLRCNPRCGSNRIESLARLLAQKDWFGAGEGNERFSPGTEQPAHLLNAKYKVCACLLKSNFFQNKNHKICLRWLFLNTFETYLAAGLQNIAPCLGGTEDIMKRK